MSKDVMINEDILEDLKKWSKYGILISGIIHNLNTPLMGISGRLELIELKHPDIKGIEQINKQLENINKALQSIAYLADKDNVERIADVDISELVEKIDSLLTANMIYKHQINVEKELESVHKTVNISVLYNCIFNLITFIITLANQEDTLFIKNDESSITLEIVKEEDNPELSVDSQDFAIKIQNDIQRLESLNITCETDLSEEQICIKLILP